MDNRALADSRLNDAARANRSLEATLYIVWGLFWLLMILIAVQDRAFDKSIRWWEPLLWEGSSGMFATAWFIVQRKTNARYAAFLDRPALWVVQYLRWMPVVIATFLPAIYLARHFVYRLVGLEYRHEPWSFVVVYETAKIFLFAGLWLGIIFGFNSYRRWQEERRELLMLQRSLAEAQLSQLKAQLRPHLFFNILNTISALMHIDVERADRLLARLGDLLRMTLQTGDRDVTSMREELRMLRLYADVMQERFSDRVTIEWHVDAESELAAAPALILQPFLENAFKHGVEPSREHVRIDIGAQRQGDRLLLCVRNSGGPLLPFAQHGIGVRNSRERLRMLFGEHADVELAQRGSFVEARIQLPWRRYAE